jgi:hypothetical protein
MMNQKKKLSLAKKMAKENKTKTLEKIAEKYSLSIQQVHNMVKLAVTSVEDVRTEFLCGNIKFSDVPKIVKLKDEETTRERLVKLVRANASASSKPANTLGNMLKELKDEIRKNKNLDKGKTELAKKLIAAMEAKDKSEVFQILEKA